MKKEAARRSPIKNIRFRWAKNYLSDLKLEEFPFKEIIKKGGNLI